MTTATEPATIQDLGDTLEAATEQDLRRARRRPVRRAAFAVLVLAIVGTGTAAAAGLLSPKQVAAAMPAGAMLFEQTDPHCATVDGSTGFRCTLSAAPSADSGVSDYRGSKQIIVVADKVAGGCIGRDHDGMSWDCWIGLDAVEHGIITKDYLGEPVLGPSQG